MYIIYVIFMISMFSLAMGITAAAVVQIFREIKKTEATWLK